MMNNGGGKPSLREAKLEQRKMMYNNRGQYSYTWQTEMKSACFSNPLFCCLAVFCSPCVSYSNRQEALHGDMRFYTCCQGLLPCSGRMKEEQCPEVCLCLEVSCCFPNSVLATRYLLQDEMQLENTKCDNCLFNTMVALQGLACVCYIASIFEPGLREAAQTVDAVADLVYCSVCACMQTQHRDQIKFRNENMQCICPIVEGNPMLAPPQAVMTANPGLTFQYPTINHSTGQAQGVPVPGQGYPGQHPQYPKA
ncbi:hypothetical protein HOP50_06g40980 [Chloropicon primus]|nr:hypothetical protein HOP50_06g40980 [Chloropicon primus]